MSLRLPSPASSSCQSSDCEGDRIVHALKRMRIDRCSPAQQSLLANEYTAGFNPKRKIPSNTSSGRKSPMIIIEPETSSLRSQKSENSVRRQKMLEMLHSQLSEYKSQYTSISERPGRSECSDFLQ